MNEKRALNSVQHGLGGHHHNSGLNNVMSRQGLPGVYGHHDNLRNPLSGRQGAYGTHSTGMSTPLAARTGAKAHMMQKLLN